MIGDDRYGDHSDQSAEATGSGKMAINIPKTGDNQGMQGRLIFHALASQFKEKLKKVEFRMAFIIFLEEFTFSGIFNIS
jgi:hypothetical protein